MATLDTLQDAVNALTSSTTSLLTEVKVNKTTLVNSATNAAASAASASSDKISAAASASQASGSATQAAASAASASAIVLGVASGYPSIAPSLMLDFANTKTLDPRITFSRASTGSYYDGKTVAKAEENLLFNSQTPIGPTNAYWSFASSTSSTATDIAGGTNGVTVTCAAGTTVFPRFFPSATTGISTGIAGQQCVVSIYAKAGTLNYFQISSYTGTAWYCNFDLSGSGSVGTYSNCTGTITPTSVTGWFRCSVLYTPSTSDIRAYFLPETSSSATRQVDWNPSGTETVIFCYPQFEQRSSVTAYTPTTTAPITNYIPALQTAAAGVARFDHNPTTGESLGLLIEEQRTNLLTYSADFSNAAWTKSGGSISADMVVAPDGTLSGDKLVEYSTNGEHFSRKVSTVTASTAYTATVYAKAGERSYVWLYGYSAPTSASAYFNLAAGTIGTTSGSPNATITPVGNGWYRCSITMTTGSTSFTYEIHSASGNDSESYQGNGYSGIYIWGAQLEAGSFATSYIPTTSAQVTRSADAASMTGTNFSSWYRANEGTLYGEWAEIASGVWGSTTSAFSVSDNTAASLGNKISIYTFSNGLRYAATRVNGTVVANATSGAAIASNVFGKTACAYKLDDTAVSTSGAAVGTDTSCGVPVVDRAYIGTIGSNGDYLNGTIKKLAYYPKRLTNTELQAVTTA